MVGLILRGAYPWAGVNLCYILTFGDLELYSIIYIFLYILFIFYIDFLSSGHKVFTGHFEVFNVAEG